MRRRNIAASNVALGLMMIASLVALHAMGSHGFLFDFFAIPSMALPVIFIWPLCEAVLHGLAKARESTGVDSPGVRFRNAMRHPVRLWFILWTVYFVVLEIYLGLVAGGGNLVVTVPSLGWIFLLVASCVVWAPRCRKLWKLILLTFSTVVLVFTVLGLLSFAIVLLLGRLGIMGLGYMDLGLVTMPPLVATLLSFASALGALIWAWRKGEAWFRVQA